MVYSRTELVSDAVVHVAGLAFALIAAPVLVVLAFRWFGDIGTVTATTIYAVSLLAMLTCSAIYNMVTRPEWGDRLRRLDQSAIYMKIAGTYTPFAVLTGTHAGLFLAGIWGASLTGASMILFGPARWKRPSFALYLAIGWAGVLFGGPLDRRARPGLAHPDPRGRTALFARRGVPAVGTAPASQHRVACLRSRGDGRCLCGDRGGALRQGSGGVTLQSGRSCACGRIR